MKNKKTGRSARSAKGASVRTRFVHLRDSTRLCSIQLYAAARNANRKADFSAIITDALARCLEQGTLTPDVGKYTRTFDYAKGTTSAPAKADQWMRYITQIPDTVFLPFAKLAASFALTPSQGVTFAADWVLQLRVWDELPDPDESANVPDHDDEDGDGEGWKQSAV